jgi:cystathionine beta-lyase/cystathionine gamma-synthase
VVDNCFCSPALQRPLELGADIVIHSATKYLDGQGRVMGGAVLGRKDVVAEPLTAFLRNAGATLSPFNAWVILKGLETLSLRMQAQSATALALARWLETRPAVASVHHPGLESHPQHALFRRDFAGATGLFSIVLKQGSRRHTAALIDGLQHFGIGFSWGGYESLVLPVELDRIRTATQTPLPGPIVRLSIGLEDADDLIADLDAGLARYQAQF